MFPMKKFQGSPRPSMASMLAKKFIKNTLSSVKNQREKNGRRKTSIGLRRPWSTHLFAIEALVKKRAFTDEDKVEGEVSERDERVKSVVTGFLVIHVLELHKIFVTSKTYLPGVPLCLYLVAKVGRNVRTSTVYSTTNFGRIRIDCAFHMPVEISEWRDSPLNTIRIEVWGFQDPEVHYFIGKVKQQIYQYIKDTHGIHRKPIFTENTITGEMVYEFAFAYGCFGYGHSNQITNPDCPITEAVSHSMFPRIGPASEDNVSNKFAIKTPKRLHMMSILSFIQDQPPEGIVTRDGRKIEPARLKEPKRIVIGKVDYEDGIPLHCHINLKIWQTPIQADFNDSLGDFLCLTHRKDRLKFVSEMSNGRKADLREMEAGAIFESMDDEVVEKIITAQRHKDTLIYPDDFHCPETAVTLLDKTDEEFMNKFPPVRRTAGYLWAMFGFGNQEPPTVNNDMDFPAYLDAGKMKNGGYFGCRVPEVSVILPSPTDSTVNLYAYFIRPEEEVVVANTNVQEIAKQSATLAELDNEEAPNYGDVIGMEAIQSEMTTASVKKSMQQAKIVV